MNANLFLIIITLGPKFVVNKHVFSDKHIVYSSTTELLSQIWFEKKEIETDRNVINSSQKKDPFVFYFRWLSRTSCPWAHCVPFLSLCSPSSSFSSSSSAPSSSTTSSSLLAAIRYEEATVSAGGMREQTQGLVLCIFSAGPRTAAAGPVTILIHEPWQSRWLRSVFTWAATVA